MILLLNLLIVKVIIFEWDDDLLSPVDRGINNTYPCSVWTTKNLLKIPQNTFVLSFVVVLGQFIFVVDILMVSRIQHCGRFMACAAKEL